MSIRSVFVSSAVFAVVKALLPEFEGDIVGEVGSHDPTGEGEHDDEGLGEVENVYPFQDVSSEVGGDIPLDGEDLDPFELFGEELLENSDLSAYDDLLPLSGSSADADTDELVLKGERLMHDMQSFVDSVVSKLSRRDVPHLRDIVDAYQGEGKNNGFQEPRGWVEDVGESVIEPQLVDESLPESIFQNELPVLHGRHDESKGLDEEPESANNILNEYVIGETKGEELQENLDDVESVEREESTIGGQLNMHGLTDEESQELLRDAMYKLNSDLEGQEFPEGSQELLEEIPIEYEERDESGRGEGDDEVEEFPIPE